MIINDIFFAHYLKRSCIAEPAEIFVCKLKKKKPDLRAYSSKGREFRTLDFLKGVCTLSSI